MLHICRMKDLISYRATVFVESPIGYTKDNVNRFPFEEWKCMPLVYKKHSPQTINPFEIINSTGEFDGGAWKAVLPEKGVALIFLGEKIDVVGQPLIEEHSFLQMSKDIFDQLFSVYGIKKIMRFAYNPVYGEKNGNFSKMLTHLIYKSSHAENIRLSNVYRVDEDINGRNVKINYLIQIISAFCIDGDKKLPSIIYDLDINSTVVQGVTFEISDMYAFFDKAGDFAGQFMQQY